MTWSFVLNTMTERAERLVPLVNSMVNARAAGRPSIDEVVEDLAEIYNVPSTLKSTVRHAQDTYQFACESVF